MSERPPPLGFGPVLASARAVPPSQRTACLVTIGTVSLLVILYCRLRGAEWGLSIGTAAVSFVLLYVGNFNISMRAGDGWFASNNSFLRTDAVIGVRVRVTTSGTHVMLWDADERQVDVLLSDLTGDPGIWKLVTAGIDKSRLAGLAVDDNLTARVFGLPRREKPEDNRSVWPVSAGSDDSSNSPPRALDIPGKHKANGGGEPPAP